MRVTKLLPLVIALCSALYALPSAATVGGCIEKRSVASGAMTDAPYTVDITTSSTSSNYTVLHLFVSLVDANTSITRLDILCLSSLDNNTKLFTPTRCDTTVDGTCTVQSDGDRSNAQLTNPGTLNYTHDFDFPGDDMRCVVSIGAGAATATIDTIVISYRLCDS